LYIFGVASRVIEVRTILVETQKFLDIDTSIAKVTKMLRSITASCNSGIDRETPLSIQI
jgi:hypothetical protein